MIGHSVSRCSKKQVQDEKSRKCLQLKYLIQKMYQKYLKKWVQIHSKYAKIQSKYQSNTENLSKIFEKIDSDTVKVCTKNRMIGWLPF